MSLATAVVSFGEWLPDQPFLNNPGLVTASQVIPRDTHYVPFLPQSTIGNTTLTATATAVFFVSTGTSYNYVTATKTRLFSGAPPSAITATLTAQGSSEWSFLQWEDRVLAGHINIFPMSSTLSSLSSFATLTAPKANVLGRINQFVFLGHIQDTGGTTRASTARWSAIGDETNWPTPNSATAIATQAGEQDLDTTYGPIVRITTGDQYGLIFQTGAITRVTYVGPPVVFQFDTYYRGHGAVSQNAVMEVGGLTYFVAKDGFKVTDGVSVRSIGAGKVDKTFLSLVNFNTGLGPLAKIKLSFDSKNRCLLAAFASASETLCQRLWMFNIDSERWSQATGVAITAMSQMPAFLQEFALTQHAFNGSNILTRFNGAASADGSVALFRSGLNEINPGGRALVTGLKPHVEYSATATALTARVGVKANQFYATLSPITYTATLTPNTNTGWCDVLKDSKYLQAEIQINGDFDKAIGFEFAATPSGER